mmetsp:Transcript_22165/g.21388  ORF Transcript_22165/g.21388 Transcript_22165/m.21388 type:complete len:123 (-) Transcript_22165:230-598(-)
MFLMHPNSSESFKVFETGLEYIGYIAHCLKDEGAVANVQMLALRCIVNMFYNSASKFVLLKRRQSVIELIAPFLTNANKNIRMAVITIMLNYSVNFIDKNDSEGRIQSISAISEVFALETDP